MTETSDRKLWPFADVIAEWRHLTEADKVRRNSRDDFGIGPDWLHAHLWRESDTWHYIRARLTPLASNTAATCCMMPPEASRFYVALNDDGSKRFTVVVEGANYIGHALFAIDWATVPRELTCLK